MSILGPNPHPNPLPEGEGLRRGVSLMEVLISTFVVSVGLLGLAALLPVGTFAIVQTEKHDRSGACGRAGLREVKVQRMLEANPAAAAGGQSFAIDPLGVANLGQAPPPWPIPRIALGHPQDEQIFRWHDDKRFSLPENSDRPGAIQEGRAYSWLVTVSPAASEAALPVQQKTLFSVSVAVCYRRVFAKDGGETITTATLDSGGWGGGAVTLDPLVHVKRNQWIMLCGAKVNREGQEYPFAKWYRVVAGGNDPVTNTTKLNLAGPDWDATQNPTAQAVVIDSVVGVYTTTVELDRDSLWTN